MVPILASWRPPNERVEQSGMTGGAIPVGSTGSRSPGLRVAPGPRSENVATERRTGGDEETMNNAEAGVVGAEADETAFRALCAKAIPEVYSYVLHRCGGCVPVAEDLTSEVMVAAVAEFRSQGRRVDMAWLIAVAHNKLLDHWRRHEREERRLRLFWGGGAEDTGLGAWEGDEARARALGALGRVPVAQRAALTLRYLDGLSVPEVARQLGRSVHAVESLLARGRRSFRRVYLEQADD